MQITVAWASLPIPIVGSYQTQTVSSGVGGLALPTIPSNACRAVINIDTQPIKYTVDGTAPTTTNGHLMVAGTQIALETREEINGWKAIRQGGSDATLCVTYYRLGV